MVSHEVEDVLRDLLLERGYSILVPESMLARKDDGRLLLGGLFMVEDRPGKLRLIFDKRSTNFGEVPLKWFQLLMGSMFGRLRLSDSQLLRGSGYDLESFFNRLRQHPSALPRAAFGRRVLPEVARCFGLDVREPCRQVVAVCGMGGLNCPAIAQETHLAVLRASGIKTESFLKWGHALPEGPCFSGIFYDDLVVAAIIESDLAYKPEGGCVFDQDRIGPV